MAIIYTFTDKDGKTITLEGDTTMEELIEMGFTNIGIVKPEEPMKPNEYRNL